ncbi:major facilitator superfamily MFS_1 [Catenulispora acidiphila DSM 44928]|uniref:Major facilitator superfamily MFS_1 n=1 Tax=Catenulispora acidiphila (strain DSM 44928 / JCM 14897 / NBRC 102108 / NRRL B-24433 / ID139908) TaxID=479433 RepID=C7Q936_CATAD|nr:major facilitator superfamily MFS_1 [Catenulispora acidiphila DSM 44928]
MSPEDRTRPRFTGHDAKRPGSYLFGDDGKGWSAVKVYASGFRTFLILWSGQLLSLVGSALSGFALGVYVYQLTGSVTKIGLVYALSFLPLIAVSPMAGALVDRRGPRRALLESNIGCMLIMLVLAILLATHTFRWWHVYFVVSLTSVLTAMQMPAFEASVPALVAKKDLGRANGMRMFASAASGVLGPVVAGALLLAIKVQGVVLMDCLSFGFAIATLLVVRIPGARRDDQAAETSEPSTLTGDFKEGWRYVAARRGLLAMMGYLGAISFFIGVADVVITPLVLDFASARGLGAVMSIGAAGMLLTSLVMSVWGGPKRRVRGMYLFSLVMGGAIVLGSLRPNVALVALAAFLFLGAAPLIIAPSQSIVQTKVEPQLLGRVSALKNMITFTPQLVAYVLAGPLADDIFEPWVGRRHVGSSTFRTLVGDGTGRGIAFLLMVMGVLLAVTVGLAALYRPLRHVEEELPDVMSEAPEEMADGVADDDGVAGDEVTDPAAASTQ